MHVEILLAPEALENLPTAQPMHTAVPTLEENLPALQFAHVVELESAAYWPTTQLMHTDLWLAPEVFENFPATQPMQGTVAFSVY